MASGEDGSVAAAPPLQVIAARVKHYREGCPGCRLDEANESKTGIPYRNFFFMPWHRRSCCRPSVSSFWSPMFFMLKALPIQSLFPYLYFMGLKVAKEEQDIGFYAGFVGATYFLGRTISAVPWGMFADKYGRKPCIVISILSAVVFNTLFGLSTTYWMAIAYASEVCRKDHQALGISLIISSRAIALVVGPAIGGFLAQPTKKYPNLFSEVSIFGRFPYFLPCFVISVLAAGSCIACIWLPETLHFHNDDKVEAIDELEAQSGESTKNLLKNWQLMSALILYCIFYFHDTAYLEIFSLWAVSSRKFRGLSLTSQDVGTVLAVSGFGVLVYQLAIYPFLAKYFGQIKPFRPVAVLSTLLLATYPFMANLDGLELTFEEHTTITIACNILQNTAVTQEQRGVANGISVTLMSMFKAVAPAAAGSLVSWAQKHLSGLFLPGDQILFLMLNMVSVIGLVLMFKPFFSLPNAIRRP
uniref:Major facilitator superfamily (MFS) profile domain-containing protein n=1 Tax=Setaria viridis TaxID=4556 RepID=A0A4U6U9F9_SETVI|nr:hypothetical protein SEVIR_5G037200v2 [Setaria viridis]